MTCTIWQLLQLWRHNCNEKTHEFSIREKNDEEEEKEEKKFKTKTKLKKETEKRREKRSLRN